MQCFASLSLAAKAHLHAADHKSAFLYQLLTSNGPFMSINFMYCL